MTREEITARRQALLIEREELQFSMDRIKTQVTAAKRHAAATGEYGDRSWLIRAEDAIRHKGRNISQICRELSELKATEKTLNVSIIDAERDDFYRAFSAACKRRLSANLYQSLIQEAEEESRGPSVG